MICDRKKKSGSILPMTESHLNSEHTAVVASKMIETEISNTANPDLGLKINKKVVTLKNESEATQDKWHQIFTTKLA